MELLALRAGVVLLVLVAMASGLGALYLGWKNGRQKEALEKLVEELTKLRVLLATMQARAKAKGMSDGELHKATGGVGKEITDNVSGDPGNSPLSAG